MQHDHMIEALTTNGSNHSLYIGSLPRRARRRQNFTDAYISHLFSEVVAEDRIAVAQQVAGTLGKGKCLPQLLPRPLRGRLGGNVEVQNATAVMGQHQKHVKNLEADRGHGEEIKRHELLDMIFEECAPLLRRRFVAAQHVFADAALSDVDAEFEQFSMDPRCTPKGILPAHPVDENSDFTRNDRSSGSAAPHLPGPEQTKAGSMPSHDRLWLDNSQR